MGNIKSLLSLLVGFIMASLLGIASSIAIFHILIAIPGVGPSGIAKYGYSPFGDMTGFTVSIFTGLPLGSSLGIFITKKYIFRSGFRTGKFSVLCLFTSLVFGFLAVPLGLALSLIGLIRNGALAFMLIFPFVSLFALIGYNAMAVLLRGKTRDSGAADKAAIQRVRVPPCQLPDSGT